MGLGNDIYTTVSLSQVGLSQEKIHPPPPLLMEGSFFTKTSWAPPSPRDFQLQRPFPPNFNQIKENYAKAKLLVSWTHLLDLYIHCFGPFLTVLFGKIACTIYRHHKLYKRYKDEVPYRWLSWCECIKPNVLFCASLEPKLDLLL